MDIVKQKGMTTRDIVKLKVEKEFESQREKILKQQQEIEEQTKRILGEECWIQVPFPP